jgi:hypothetical protein
MLHAGIVVDAPRTGGPARSANRPAYPGHCGFTTTEWVASFEALVGWVEDGIKPDGNDVLEDDLRALLRASSCGPAPGTPGSETVFGAADRVVVEGTATVDGARFDASFLGAVLLHNGLMTACQDTLSSVADGEFELTVMADTEAAGCGAPAAQVVLWTVTGDAQLYASDALAWPGSGARRTIRVGFTTATPRGLAPQVSSFVGEILGTDGRYVQPGTLVEAFIGATRCGVASTRRTGSFSAYALFVVGPDALRGCQSGATLTFRVDGKRAAQTARHKPGHTGSSLDLIVP